MIRWPWVSRRAFDIVMDEYSRSRDENARLLEQITTLVEQVVRIQRFSQGMSEAPREPRKMEPMPTAVRESIMAVKDSRIRAMQTREAYRLYAERGSWGAVEAEFARPNPEPEPQE